MREPTDAIASLASILGSIVALFGLLHSQAWIAGLGVSFLGISIVALIYARQVRRRIQSADLSLEGLNLDSLNVANLRRRLNRTLVVQRAYHFAKFEGRDLTVAWQYEGYCRAERETSIEFSIDSEKNIPFDELDCYAFDLKEDPERLHKIRPMLVGNDGISKKVSVPLLKSLASQEPFNLLLNCGLPGSNNTGVQYYTSSLSFEQRSINQLVVHLQFVRNAPEWMRVYDCCRTGPTLISEMRPFKNDGESCEYLDLVRQAGGQSLRIYVYKVASTSD